MQCTKFDKTSRKAATDGQPFMLYQGNIRSVKPLHDKVKIGVDFPTNDCQHNIKGQKTSNVKSQKCKEQDAPTRSSARESLLIAKDEALLLVERSDNQNSTAGRTLACGVFKKQSSTSYSKIAVTSFATFNDFKKFHSAQTYSEPTVVSHSDRSNTI